MKRGSSGINALLAVDKPVGMTSHDVVSRVRRALGEKRVGHAGTLDPLASGVLVVGIGSATRLLGMLTLAEKRYQATISFGTETTTDDSEGEVVVTKSVPAECFDPSFARETLAQLEGEQDQIPPSYSAISVGGKRAYALAREGKDLEIPARHITVYQARLVSLSKSSEDSNDCLWTVDLRVSKGTYIRSIARDMGRKLGTAAHISTLRRVVSGSISLDDCIELSLLETRGASCIDEYRLDPAHALQLPLYRLNEREFADVVVGRRIAAGEVEDKTGFSRCPSRRPPQQNERIALVYEGALCGVWQCQENKLVCCANFSQGIGGVSA